MRLAVDASELLNRNGAVARRRRKRDVPEQGVDDGEVGAAIEEHDSERVAERVRV
jgi:hypothetical protein